MFKRLKEKWKLSWTSFVLVFCTFAIGGSSCGYLGRKILSLTGLELGGLYYTLYIILILKIINSKMTHHFTHLFSPEKAAEA